MSVIINNFLSSDGKALNKLNKLKYHWESMSDINWKLVACYYQLEELVKIQKPKQTTSRRATKKKNNFACPRMKIYGREPGWGWSSCPDERGRRLKQSRSGPWRAAGWRWPRGPCGTSPSRRSTPASPAVQGPHRPRRRPAPEMENRPHWGSG